MKFHKFLFVDFTVHTKSNLVKKILSLTKNDGIIIRQTEDLQSIKWAVKIARRKKILIFSHFQNTFFSQNIHFASSNFNKKCFLKSVSIHSMNDIFRIKTVKPHFAFVSPIFETQTHKNAKPLGVIQCCKIALEIRKVSEKTKIILLGGMDAQKFRKIQKITKLFNGFAGIRKL